MRKLIFVPFLVFLLALTACNVQPDVTPTLTLTTGGSEVTSTVTPAPVDNGEEPPQSPELVIILSPPESDPALLSDIQNEIQPVVTSLGYVLEVRQELSPEAAPPELVLVVLAGSLPGAADLINVLPNVDFLAVSRDGLPASPNLTVLSAGADPTHQAFLAGYIGGVQSEEWRIGMIAANDAEGIRYRKAFLNGAIYFCGVCQPIYPPFGPYPIYVELPVGSDPAALEAAAEQLLAQGVTMVHVAPELQSGAIFQFLAQRGAFLIGTEPPPDEVVGNWVASVLMTSSFSQGEAVGLILSGQEVPATSGGIEISYAGISQARLEHFAEMLQKLQSGEIDPIGNVD